MSMTTDITRPTNRRPLISAGTLLGIGLGGFVDGIVLHQMLQVHNMLSAKRPKDSIVNMEINMVWDGLFHAFTWMMTALGLWMLWRAVTRRDVPLSGKPLFGAMVFGWGLFNFVEGLIDHHVLHIRPAGGVGRVQRRTKGGGVERARASGRHDPGVVAQGGHRVAAEQHTALHRFRSAKRVSAM